MINNKIRIKGFLNGLKRKDFVFSKLIKGVIVVILVFTLISYF